MFTFVRTGQVLMLLVAVSATGCMKPYKVEKFEEAEPHETVFVVSLEGDTAKNQDKLDSLELLESQMVSRKRIVIPQRERKIGHRNFQIEWIDTVRVIKVNRRPVTREWTADPTSGTSNRHQALEVESLDSINFSLGATITCSISEEDAPKFLYYFANQSLEQVVDNIVRGFVQTRASAKFGEFPVDQTAAKQSEIGEEILKESRTTFKDMGITVEFFGWVGGMRFINPVIQDSIDELFVNENEILTARQKQEVQRKDNAIMVEKAIAERDAAIQTYLARDASLFKTNLQIRKLRAEAKKALAENFDGTLPQIIPQGSGLLFGLDGAEDETLLEFDFSKLPDPSELQALLKEDSKEVQAEVTPVTETP